MNRAVFVLICCLLGCSANDQPSENQSHLPNIVIVVLDTVRFDFLSLADKKLDTTPNLLRLAQKGINFKKAYATYDNTPDSHFSIFTGYHKGRKKKYDVPENSIAHHLKNVGYHSLGISANMVVRPKSLKTVRAFDRYISPIWQYFTGATGKKDKKGWFRTKYLEGVSESEKARIMGRLESTYDRFNAPSNPFPSSLVLSAAEDVNRVLATEIEKLTKPGLLFLNYVDAHDPYYPAEEFYNVDDEPYLDKFYSDLRSRKLPSWMEYPNEKIEDEKKRKNFLNRKNNTFAGRKTWCLSDDINREQMERYKARYKAEIKYLDHHIGKMIDILKESDFFDNTLIIITADHGESFGEKKYITHWFHNKGDKESTRHVPFLVLPPDAKPQRAIENFDTVSIADIPPTIYDYLGIDYSAVEQEQGDNMGTSRFSSLSKYLKKRNTGHRITLTEKVEEPKDESKSSPKKEESNDASKKAPEPEKTGETDEEMINALKAMGYVE